MSLKVLVTGATGNVGSWVVQELRGHGASIRAFVRDPDRAAEKLGDDVELAVGDFSDTSSLHRALEVADHLFLTSADSGAGRKGLGLYKPQPFFMSSCLRVFENLVYQKPDFRERLDWAPHAPYEDTPV